MKISTLYKLTYIYLVLPLLVFILSWLDYSFAMLYSLVFICAFYMAYPQQNTNITICSNKDIFIITLIAGTWCFLAGIGYFYYQSFDYHFRNAVFRDLINYEWPVFYKNADTPLVYYMAFWLVPASVAKFCKLFISADYNLFMIGNYALFIYAVLGVILILAHLIKALEVNRLRQIISAVFLFIFFSGMDVIGHRYFLIVDQPFDYHLEWWATFIQYSSITTDMFWVFNQFIPTALITLLIYNERNIRNFGFLIALSLFFAPYPTFGIGLFMLVYVLTVFFKITLKKDFIKQELLTIPNIIGVFWLLPLSILYFITNSEGMDRWHYIFDYTSLERFLLFIVLEFFLYVLILLPIYKKNVFFSTMAISLLLIPFLRLDQQNNFCMRASIPAIIILSVFVIRFLLKDYHAHYFRTSLIVIIYLIGVITPLNEFYRGIHYTREAQKINLVQDEIHTLNRLNIPMPVFGFDVNHQFTAKNYRKDIFWRYIAKHH